MNPVIFVIGSKFDLTTWFFLVEFCRYLRKWLRSPKNPKYLQEFSSQLKKTAKKGHSFFHIWTFPVQGYRQSMLAYTVDWVFFRKRTSFGILPICIFGIIKFCRISRCNFSAILTLPYILFTNSNVTDCHRKNIHVRPNLLPFPYALCYILEMSQTCL